MRNWKACIVLVVIILITGVIFWVYNKNDKLEEKTPDNCNNIQEVEEADISETEGIIFEKPVIYLYPEVNTQINIQLDYDGDLICTYPEYNSEWNIIAEPDGTIHKDGKEYSYLFWEGTSNYQWNIDEGFVVEGKNTLEFLEASLQKIGLHPKEYNDFIVYWLPRMQQNKYNLIYFAGEEYEQLAQLEVNPKPDSILRVFMVYKSLEEPIDINEQQLKTFERSGFTLVEWGGTEIN